MKFKVYAYQRSGSRATLTKKLYNFNSTVKYKFTIVNYNIIWLKTIVLWNFDLLLEINGTMIKNYGTMEKAIVPYKEIWNFDLRRKKTW